MNKVVVIAIAVVCSVAAVAAAKKTELGKKYL